MHNDVDDCVIAMSLLLLSGGSLSSSFLHPLILLVFLDGQKELGVL